MNPARSGRAQSRAYTIGSFLIEPDRNCVAGAGTECALEPRIMDVLCALADYPGHVISRDALIERVWGVDIGADESLTRAISILRKTFRDAGEAGEIIETIPKRGYRLVASVSRKGGDAQESGKHPQANEQIAVSGYSIALLAIEPVSSPTYAFLADGITRDLTSLLSRIPRLRVAAYNSATAQGVSLLPLAEIGRALDVRYVVSGSLTARGEQLQLRLALMDALTNAQIWSKRIDQPIERFYATETELLLDISTSIFSELQVSEAADVRKRQAHDLSCHELIQSAETLRSLYSRTSAAEIVVLLTRALELEPENAAAHAALATQYAQNVASNWTNTPEETLAEAESHVLRALKLAPRDPEVLMAAGIVATFSGDAELAVRRLRQSQERNPNNPHVLATLGWQTCWLTGDCEGVEMIKTAEARAPHHPRHALWALYRGLSLTRLGRLDEAVDAHRTSIDRNPNYFLTHAHLACTLVMAGRDDEAADTLRSMLLLSPDYTLEDYDRLMRRHRLMFAPPFTLEDSIEALQRIWPSSQTAPTPPVA